MSKVHIAKWFVGAMLVGSIATPHAATISLPANEMVLLGDQLTLDLAMDFTDDRTLGGGIDIFYDASRLQFVSFVFNPGLGDDPDFRRQPDNLPNELNGLAFGNFSGLSGPALVGTFTFNTLNSGDVQLSLGDNDLPLGGFFSATSFQPQVVDYLGSLVNITVPVPAALWLFLSGMGLLLGLNRKGRG